MEHPDIGGGNNGGDGFIDRSKVRILLCDNHTNSSEEVFKLLCKCSYQVTSVRSARQVIDALNAEGPDIDIILAEVDLPMTKGMKMLKYIARDKDLQRIPVIMMSALDEVSVVVKCLRLGAADYLVKPLRTNELLNLWTHMWRRRRMLGLAEKNILTYDFDLVGSDPSDANTNSTTLFSDDTDERSRKTTNLEANLSLVQRDESTAVATTVTAVESSVPVEHHHIVPGISDGRTGQLVSGPKRSELKVGESSAFFTYVKSSMVKNSHAGMTRENLHAGDGQVLMHTGNKPQLDLSGFPAQSTYSYYMSGMANQITMPSSPKLYQKNLHYLQNPLTSDMMMSQYDHLTQCHPPVPGMTSFPYYPISLCLQPGQMPSTHPWPSFGNSSEPKSSKVDRREAALIKFRQKRKERCFDKKIRYVNRKKLAERRPRVRGQFVRKVKGVNVDLNGEIASAEFEEDEEEYEEQASRDSSPEDDTCSYKC